MNKVNFLLRNKVFDFLSEVKVELGKVSWPGPEQTIQLTVIVLIVTVAVGFFLGGVDYILTKLLELVLSK